jgi:putative transposase
MVTVGTVGDGYDNTVAERVNGLLKAEVIYRQGQLNVFEAVGYDTLDWVG